MCVRVRARVRVCVCVCVNDGGFSQLTDEDLSKILQIIKGTNKMISFNAAKGKLEECFSLPF